MDNVLQHHGILGMRWGVRRFQNSDGSLTPAGRRRVDKRDSKLISEDAKVTKALSKRKLGSLSNAEIRKINERLQLEHQYKILNRSTMSSGKKLTNKILSRIGDKVFDKVFEATIGTQLNKVFNK